MFLCELRGDINWDGGVDGGSTRRYQLLHCHLSATWPYWVEMGWNGRGWEALTTEMGILPTPPGIRQAAVDPVGGQRGWAAGV